MLHDCREESRLYSTESLEEMLVWEEPVHQRLEETQTPMGAPAQMMGCLRLAVSDALARTHSRNGTEGQKHIRSAPFKGVTSVSISPPLPKTGQISSLLLELLL